MSRHQLETMHTHYSGFCSEGNKTLDINMSTKNFKKFIIITTIFTIGSIGSIWLFWQNVFLLTFILICLAIMEFIALKKKEIIITYFVIMFGGVMTEVVAIHLGAWRYTEPSFWGIPLWLLPAWGNAGIIGVCVYKLVQVTSNK